MGLFGSIGKLFGGALRVAGKVAGVASAIAPIPGLGFAGKVATGLGGILGKAKAVQSRVRIIPPGVLASTSSVMPGGSLANQSFYQSGYVGSGAGPGGVAQTARAISKAMGGKKRRKRAASSTRRRKRRRSRRGLTAAQLRAGFGGKRRMRRR